MCQSLQNNCIKHLLKKKNMVEGLEIMANYRFNDPQNQLFMIRVIF